MHPPTVSPSRRVLVEVTLPHMVSMSSVIYPNDNNDLSPLSLHFEPTTTPTKEQQQQRQLSAFDEPRNAEREVLVNKRYLACGELLLSVVGSYIPTSSILKILLRPPRTLLSCRGKRCRNPIASTPVTATPSTSALLTGSLTRGLLMSARSTSSSSRRTGPGPRV